MRAGILTLAALTAAVSAQPYHNRQHRHAHAKREDVVVVDTEVDYVTATAPQVIVYVDVNGDPVSTAYGDAVAAATPTAASKEQEVKPAATTTVAPPAYTAPAYTAPAYTAPVSSSSSAVKSAAAPSASSVSGGATTGRGVSYSPYTTSGCKTQDQINTDLAALESYSMIRLYGTDCDQTNMVLNAVKGKNVKVFAGIYNIENIDPTVATSETSILISTAKAHGWDSFDTIAVGNELVNAGTYDAATVVAALNKARSSLRSAGYDGPVVTVDTFVAIFANPSLCENSDYNAANIHAFFDGGVTAAQAGEFVQTQAKNVANTCSSNNKTVVTESGWPYLGDANGQAVPSRPNQEAAISSLKSAFSDNIILFTAYDDPWKAPGAYNCEQYWGFVQQ